MGASVRHTSADEAVTTNIAENHRQRSNATQAAGNVIPAWTLDVAEHAGGGAAVIWATPHKHGEIVVVHSFDPFSC